jgi:hypothetical protein
MIDCFGKLKYPMAMVDHGFVGNRKTYYITEEGSNSSRNPSRSFIPERYQMIALDCPTSLLTAVFWVRRYGQYKDVSQI